jgi:hypothetical protein
MPGPRFTCTLTTQAEPACTTYARVTITDATGDHARACARHAVAALDAIDGAHVDWADSRGLNEYEQKALELSEEAAARWIPRGEAEQEAEAEVEVEVEAEL